MPTYSQLPLFSGRARIITHVTGWLFVFFTFFYLISGVRGVDEALGRTCVNLAFMLTIFYGNARSIVNRYEHTGQLWRQVGLAFVLWLVATALRTWIELYCFGGSLFSDRLPPDYLVWRLFLGYGLSFFLLLIFSILYQLVENRRALELRHIALERQHTEAQLNYLKAQINPHFLFNTLNNIYAAATLQHPRTADMVLRLSDLLRYVTYDAQASQVPLDKEMDHIQAYLDLFQLKSEAPLPIQFEVLGDTSTHKIEPLLLLPLVENAMKHGDLEENSRAFLKISLLVTLDELRFCVENTFNPENAQKDAFGGVGLENVRQRLALNHPGRHQFTVQPEGKVFMVEIKLSGLGGLVS